LSVYGQSGGTDFSTQPTLTVAGINGRPSRQRSNVGIDIEQLKNWLLDLPWQRIGTGPLGCSGAICWLIGLSLLNGHDSYVYPKTYPRRFQNSL